MSTAIREPAEYVPSGGGSFRESASNFRTLFEAMASAILPSSCRRQPPRPQESSRLAFATKWQGTASNPHFR